MKSHKKNTQILESEQVNQCFPQISLHRDSSKMSHRKMKTMGSVENPTTHFLSQQGTPRRINPTQHINLFDYLSSNMKMMQRSIQNSMTKTMFLGANVTRNIKYKQRRLDKLQKEEWFETNKKNTRLGKSRGKSNRKMEWYRIKNMENYTEKFVGRALVPLCFDGLFQKSRVNSCMITLTSKTSKSTLALVGGSSAQMSASLPFHLYSPKLGLWEQLKDDKTTSPHFNLSQHLVLEYKQIVFIIGGISIFPSLSDPNVDRYSVPYISTFNLKNNKWGRINWSVCLRAHAGTLLQNFAIIDGGINQDNLISSHIYMMDLSENNSPVLISSKSLGLAFHKMVCTNSIQESTRSLIMHEGIYCFGGKREDGTLNSKLYLMSQDNIYHDLYERLSSFEWNTVETNGQMPQSRYQHSMNLIESKLSPYDSKIYCAIIGGISESEAVLDDIWMLDLGSMVWNQIQLSYMGPKKLYNGLAGHSTSVINNQIFVFGGFNKQRVYESVFWTVGCEKLKIDVGQ